MLVKDLGELGLIKRIKKSIKTDSSVIEGIGDDCAVMKFNKTHYLLYTSDMLVEGVDFTAKDSLYLVGRKALGMALSDIAACAGIPRFALVSLGLPKTTPVSSVDRIYKGINYFAKKYGINVVGGDLSHARQLTIDISLMGLVEKQNLTLRSGAKVGDIIFVTGSFGGSQKGKHLKFFPRLKEARFLVEGFKINSMIDVSDGLSIDLSHILELSKVGGIIFEDLIPLNKDCLGLSDALYSGEDFELLFTMSFSQGCRLSEKKQDFHPVGMVMPQRFGFCLVDKHANLSKLVPKGFAHF